jgi:molybdopterin molybdotransferase
MELLSVQDARQRILKHFQPVGKQTLPLQECAGRVLASDILSTDLPLFDNSSVDGFAVMAADLAGASPARPRALHVVADIPAGIASDVHLQTGEAARIMTGAPLPLGADAVVMVEDTDFTSRDPASPAPAQVKAHAAVAAGDNIRRRGMDLTSGRRVLASGHRLRPQDLGMLAMLNQAEVPVVRRPRVAIFSSGDELVPAGGKLAPGKIRETNSHVLSALIVALGCEVALLGIAPDNKTEIQALFERARTLGPDAIISTAGVSVGAMDFVRSIVAAEGHIDFWGVNMRPGKPLAVGDYKGIPFIGLPGNPVSAFVGFEVFVRPALMRLAGREPVERPRVKVVLAEAVESDGRESYLRAIVELREDGASARLTGHQGSGNLFSLVEANALLLVPAGVKSLPIGSRAEAWML